MAYYRLNSSLRARWLCGLLVLTLAACGGGSGGGGPGGGGGGGGAGDGGGDGGGGGGDGGSGGWSPGVFLSSDTFANQCARPRSVANELQGTVLDENNFLRSYSNETYLWYDEIVDQDPAFFGSPVQYFDELRTTGTTSSGQPKDEFHFTYPTDLWGQLSQSGTSPGYGAHWIVVSENPLELYVAFTEPGSPATGPTIDLERGAAVLQVDGINVADGNIADLNAGLFPAVTGESHTFTVRDLGAPGTRVVTMTSERVTLTPVPTVKAVSSSMGPVGYLLFNDHTATAEGQLIDAIDQLAADSVQELVLDIRYNGGGYLAIASQLAYMIAGDVPTAGRTFEDLQFNDKHPITNPVTGEPLEPMPFFTETLDFSEPPGQALPTLNLERVFVLTGPSSCSASESIINSLRGVDVEVIQIGSTTCGKPYGFYPTGNCGTTYFTIQFRGVNAKGFGDYADGFSPQGTGVGEPLPGCSVLDDLSHPLGDPLENRFKTALAYLESGACPAQPATAESGAAKAAAPLLAIDGIVPKPPWRENRILRQ